MRHVSSITALALVIGLVAVAAAGPFFDMAGTPAGEKTGQNDRIIAETIWFQGYLADKDTGDPIEGEHTVEIAILDAEVLGTEIWGPEAHDETIFSAGWFTVEMGIDQPLPSFDDPPYYLELSVDGEIFEPRIRMASVPFAFHANSSELDDADWAVDGTVMYPATAETVSIGSTDPLTPLYVETMGAGPGLGIMTPNGEGESAIVLAAGSDPGDILLIDKFGSEMSPERDLSVRGKGAVLTGPSASGLLLGTMAGPIDFIVEGFGEPDRQFQAMHISEEGQVGIGTTLPDTTLHVMGTTKTLGFQMPTGATDGYVLKSDDSGIGTWQIDDDSDLDWTVEGGQMYPATAETIVIGGTSGPAPLNVWGDGLFPNALFTTTGEMGTASVMMASEGFDSSCLIVGHTGVTPEKGERQFGDPGKGFVLSGPEATGLQLISENGPIDFLLDMEVGPARQTNGVRITEAGDVGIGTTTPDTTLHVSGGIKTDALQMPTGASDGHVLTSDASGNASWEESSSGASGIIIDRWIEGATTTIGTDWTQYDNAAVSVTVPGSGYVMVTSSVHCRINHTNGTEDHLRVGHTDNLANPPTNYTTINHVVPSSFPTDSTIDVGFTVSSMHEVGSGGTYTYYLVGLMSPGQDVGDVFYYSETRAIYYPYTIPAMSAEQQDELELIEQKKALLNE